MNRTIQNHKLFSVILIFCVLLVFCIGCSDNRNNNNLQKTVTLDFTVPKNYKSLYETLEVRKEAYDDFRDMATSSIDMEVAEDAAVSDTGNLNTSTGSNKSYSETNIQVPGIDESDIVKTDGDSIYVLRNNKLLIFAADGKNTVLCSKTAVGTEWSESKDIDGTFSYICDTPYALYLTGNQLVVLSEYTYSDTENDNHIVHIHIYDVSDPAAPTLLQTLGQDGYYTDSRLMDGVLYLFSSYSIPAEITEDDPATYVPSFYRNKSREIIACDCIVLPPECCCNRYTVLASYDLENGTRLSETAVLDDGSTLYMSYNNIYLFRSVYEETASEPYTDGQYSVVDYASNTSTNISRFSIEDSLITLAATGTIDGYLVNQFAADEQDNILRVVTTVEHNHYSIYTDPEHEWENYDWENPTSSSSLYTLDENLQPVGSITGLSENEYVYSVRFMEDIAYFVTFYQTDPLFAVDVSDPAAPALLDSLKITGFSEYLHPYSDGLLFGLGMEADPETGIQKNMKLTMFDISEPATISAAHTKQLNIDWSIARSNHKAILISAKCNLIGFPVEGGYLIYGYSETHGFYLQAELKFGNDFWNSTHDSRGLFIDDAIYIIGNDSLLVLSMTDFTTIADCSFID